MEIYLIRHTTPKIEKGICYGQSEIQVTDNFETEAKDTLRKVPPTIKTIYTSPMTRCKMLADFLSRTTKIPVIQDARLKELDFGDWEMKRWDDINQSHLMKWMNNYEVERCPRGESYIDLVTRVKDFIQNMTAHNGPVLIVTHAGVIKAFHALINQKSLQAAMDLKIGYGEIISMTYKSL